MFIVDISYRPDIPAVHSPPRPPYPPAVQAWLYSSKLRDVEKLLEELKKMPYWERKGGRDHIFTLSHDQVCAVALLGAQGERGGVVT